MSDDDSFDAAYHAAEATSDLFNRELLLFRVLRDEDRTRVETRDDVMGWGVQFPTGQCYVDWYREAYAPEDRLDNPHVSIYGSLSDVEQGTGGTVQPLAVHEVMR
ncbi:hypothetical protein [Halomarina oriensis]|uniref:Uncharacterized protein n=1 Tax=Halomarina oriensis TaxID=671145 RepID=A0A6B0GXS7_9EURY|nr:hypothetical protein [Halomarina oriensis]MWG36945.1 hypothetical protein [Halomarina oriensis]